MMGVIIVPAVYRIRAGKDSAIPRLLAEQSTYGEMRTYQQRHGFRL
jgi:hypothetical protein